MITLFSVIWLDMRGKIKLPLHSYYIYCFIYCSMVEGWDDYCLGFGNIWMGMCYWVQYM